jgi:hypothetical protein
MNKLKQSFSMVKPFDKFIAFIEVNRIDKVSINLSISVSNTVDLNDDNFNIILLEKRRLKNIYSFDENVAFLSGLKISNFYLFIFKFHNLLKMVDLDFEQDLLENT